MKAWLFQHTPDMFQASVGRVGSIVQWKATRYFNDMKEGDLVLFWMSGEAGGLTGWGIIAGPAQQQISKSAQGDRRIPVRTHAIFLSPPIPREKVRELPPMADFRLFGSGFGPVGTNFRLAPQQAEAIARLIQEHGYDPPPLEGLEPHPGEDGAPPDDLPEGAVTTKINVRSGPGTNFDQVGELEQGVPVRIVDEQGEWLEIFSGDIRGFVQSRYISRGDRGSGRDSSAQMHDQDSGSGASGQQPEMLLLFDISKVNPVDDYSQLAQHTAGGFIRASAGLQKDEEFDRHWSETGKEGVKRGAYHVWDPETGPDEQADFFFKIVLAANQGDPPDLGELPPAVDIERAGGPKALKAFIEAVETRFNRRPLIYTRAVLWDQFGETLWAAEYPLWVAHYPQDLDASRLNTDLRLQLSEIEPRLPKAWESAGWSLWQFTDQGNGPEYGINQEYEAINLTAFRGTQADLLALSLSREPATVVEGPTFIIPERASFVSDSPGIADSLNFKTYVEGFARLIADKKVSLPLAIGLFGNWGVGKTHFINMLKWEIDRLVREQDGHPPSQQKYVPWIRPITFNAWHYIDTNLWASLATAIFDRLALEIKPEEKDYEKKRRELRAQLDSSSQLRNQAEERKKTASENRKEAEKKLKETRDRRAKKQKEFNKKQLEIFLAKFELAGSRENIEKVARQFGLDPAVNTMDDARALAEDFRDLGGRSAALWRALVSHFSTWPKTFLSLGVLIVVVVLIVNFPELVGWLWGELDMPELPASISQSLDWVLQLSAGVSAVMGWAGSRMNALRSGVDKFEKMEEQYRAFEKALLEGDADEKPKEDQALIQLTQDIADLDKEIIDAEQEIESATKVIEDAQAELQRINMGGLVYDFATSRTQDVRYLENLGLISVIHKDMETLQDLIDDWDRGEAEAQTVAGRNGAGQSGAEAETGPEGADAKAAEAITSAALGQDPTHRIVLYIDDLDRCPLDKVVDVLQAVHLLLAFKLFVVVVAVDPRWLERSLYKAYVPETLRDESHNDREHPERNFSAQNYLEKIFQIPFSIPRMERSGFQQMVDDLVETRSESALKGAEAGPGGDGQPGPGGGTGLQPDPDDDPDKTPSNGDETDQVNGGAPNGAGGSGGADLGENGGISGGDDMDDGGKETAEEKTKEAAEPPIFLEDHEETALKLLYPFVRTPRLTKRLLNIYRLIRFQVGFDPGRYEAFIDREQGRYFVAMLILALNTGFPEVAGLILPLLQDQAVPPDWNTFLTDLKTGILHYAGVEKQEEDYQPPVWLPEKTARKIETEAFMDMRKAFDECIRQAGELEEPLVVPTDIALYQGWAAQAGRFSFHWHLD